MRTSRVCLRLVAAALLALVSGTAVAQTPPRPTADTLALEQIEVRATRTAATAATAPFAVAVRARPPRALETEAALALADVLAGLPGLYLADRENFSLGERLAIRGQGARAAFGVRGVQVVLDGVPLTLPDGQAALTIADPALVRQAELLRGPASTFWGNGGGGVLFLRTLPEEPRLARARALGGTYGLRRAEAEGATPLGGRLPGRAGAFVSHVRREGYRAHSAYEIARARLFGEFDLGRAGRLTLTGAAEHAPEQRHPGALTADELRADPRQAEARFVNQAAGKRTTQGQVGAALRMALPWATLEASAFGVARRLDNPLPFAYIDLDRRAGGARLAAERTDEAPLGGRLTWSLGAETGLQADSRRNFANAAGTRGARRLDQAETVAATAAFGQATWARGPLRLSGALRRDAVRFEARDRFLDDGDQSGRRTLGAWSASAGAAYALGPALVFASTGSAFETPTTTELANRPDGAGGFNPDVGPQRARGAEAGVRGVVAGGRLYLDAAVFALAVQDQLVPFQGADGRTYFRNADGARHAGLELLAEARPVPALALRAGYTGGRYVFRGGAADGRAVPGLPAHRGFAEARLTRGALAARLALDAAAPTWADDDNTVRADAYAAVHASLAHTGLATPAGRLVPFADVRNLLDARYVGSVAPNAAGGRYFEPAAGRALHLGLALSAR
ncbi:MAG: TonB-dependent receptor domain-containing protein [Rubricoccaceae bacterium]